MSLQPVRGTHDLYSDTLLRHEHIINTSQKVASCYGYQSIATPIFEYSSVFLKTIGDTSDIVGKEMYTFLDRGGEELALRPEGTASVIRAAISLGLTQNLPLKLMYSGPMFRYERPQKGRTRQFHQVGAECIGVAEPLIDAEVIAMAAQILDQLGVLSYTVLNINTLGDAESRSNYRQALIEYFVPYKDELSPDSQMRLERNPLRILDSKNVNDQIIVAKAPTFEDFRNQESKDFFEQVLEGLTNLKISYVVNPRLVRGLDYYNHTAFEFVTDHLGAQGTVLAGGRYNGLMKLMGGPDLPGIGWALGVERLAMLLNDVPSQPRPITVVSVGDETREAAFSIAIQLRNQGIPVEFSFTGNVAKQLKRADKANAQCAVFLGADEISQNVVTLRNLDTGDQTTIAISELSDYLVAISTKL